MLRALLTPSLTLLIPPLHSLAQVRCIDQDASLESLTALDVCLQLPAAGAMASPMGSVASDMV
jgi:hypothetical protein